MPITTEPSTTAGGERIFAFGPFRLFLVQRVGQCLLGRRS